MTNRRTGEPAIFAATAELLVERVFGAVAALGEQVLACRNAAAARRERLQSRHLAQIRPGLIRLLDEYRDVVVGMGMIVVPDLLPNEHRRLEWWQYLPGRDEPSALGVDLNPESLGFYDYDTAEWFRVPRGTGRRHIVGPYVDAHGTDRYLLTFTIPVIAEGTFIGVVGADVPVARFERHLLRAWSRHVVDGPPGADGPFDGVGDVGSAVMIINSQDRVVVSNHVRALSGDLVPESAIPPSCVRVALTDVPWQLVFSARGDGEGN